MQNSCTFGLKIGKLELLYPTKHPKWSGIYWACKCECGSENKIYKEYLLKNNKLNSCGCDNGNAKRILNAIPRKWKHVMNIYKNRALKRDKREFSLSEIEFKTLIESVCVYCGDTGSNCIYPKPKKTSKKYRIKELAYYYNGIDRIDNTKGYTLENCIPCCWRCNQAKHDMEQREFLAWITRITLYRKVINAGTP